MTSPAVTAEFEIVLEPKRLYAEYWKDLWRFRELFYFLAWRDVKVRYKQAVFGILWAIMRPLLTMLIFTFVFGRIAKLPSGGVPYPLFVLAGMLPWQLVASSLAEASESLTSNSAMISKVYFPRMIVPASAILVNLFDFGLTLILFLGYMALLRVPFSARIAVLPLFLGMALVFSLGLGLFLSALNVRFRDFRYVVPFLLQLGLYASPVGYDTGLIPSRLRFLYALNPMVGIIDGFRWSLFGVLPQQSAFSILTAASAAVLTLFAGVYYFRRTERTFADLI
jgi:lipopolysaccharide transport system permease protein